MIHPVAHPNSRDRWLPAGTPMLEETRAVHGKAVAQTGLSDQVDVLADILVHCSFERVCGRQPVRPLVKRLSIGFGVARCGCRTFGATVQVLSITLGPSAEGGF